MVGIVSEQYLNINHPYKLLPKQYEVMKLCFKKNSWNNYVLYSGAFGAGKTLLLAMVGIKAALDYPKSVGFTGSLTYPQISDVVFRKYCQIVDAYQEALKLAGIDLILLKKKVVTSGRMCLIFYNDSEIWFRSCDEERNLAGKDLDWFELDEPVDIEEGVMTQMIGRLRGENIPQRFGLLATNPGSETHWIYRYFFTEIKEGYYVVETSTYDNFLIPNYDAYIKGMEERYDEDWINRYLKGNWGAFAGQIYKEFDIDRHVGKFQKRKDIIRYIAGVDWGARNPTCIVVIGVTKDNICYVVEEFYQANRTTPEIAEKLAILYDSYKMESVYCDPSALDLITQARDKGVPILKADNNVQTGIGTVRSLFKNDMLFFDTLCINAIREHQSYRYERDRQTKNLTETPIKKDDHACDAVRYAFTNFNPFRKSTEIGFGYWNKQRWN